MATNPITKSFDPSTFNEIVPRVFITYKGGAEYASTGLFGAECFINTAWEIYIPCNGGDGLGPPPSSGLSISQAQSEVF